MPLEPVGESVAPYDATDVTPASACLDWELGARRWGFLQANDAYTSLQIHAEQFLVLNCVAHDEPGIQVLAVSEAPCGHCRQFFAELSTADSVRFVFGTRKLVQAPPSPGTTPQAPGTPHHHLPRPGLHDQPRQTVVHTLDELLIDKFGPDDLAGDDPFPLLLEEQANSVQLSPAARAVVAERIKGPGGADFAQAAEAAGHWANTKVGWLGKTVGSQGRACWAPCMPLVVSQMRRCQLTPNILLSGVPCPYL